MFHFAFSNAMPSAADADVSAASAPGRREFNVRELLELERQIYQESIDRVAQQQEQLRRGSLEEFVRRCRPFETDRERELEAALAQLQFSKRDALSLLDFDLQQAEDVFRADRRQLKRRLLDSAKRQRLRLEKRLKALDSPGIKPAAASRKAREVDIAVPGIGGCLEPKTLEKQLRRAQRRAQKTFNFRHLAHGVLPTPQRIVQEVMTECGHVQESREHDEAVEMAAEEGLPPLVDVSMSRDGQQLVCRIPAATSVPEVTGNGCNSEEAATKLTTQRFRVGDAVVLTSRLTDEEFYGYVASFSLEDVRLVLVCGTHVRVTLGRLRSGWCSLRKQPEALVSGQEQEDEQHDGEDASAAATSLDELLRDPPDARRRVVAALSTKSLLLFDIRGIGLTPPIAEADMCVVLSSHADRRKRKTTIDIRRGF
ncbi:hypothetical protein BBJ28_00017542 [Nothophytophthora sp. Chile5]|nr:hypothetical protein BBJ28_00017542 [Nothophytophthora sp. Chile5]